MEVAKKLHARLIRNGSHTTPVAILDVLRVYALSPSFSQGAHLVFNQIEAPTLSIWNWMIRGYSLSDRPSEAICMYDQMRFQGVKENKLTFTFVFKACARVPDISYGRKIHVHCLKLGFDSCIFISNILIHMYASSGELNLAHKVFDAMLFRDLVSWNSLICGYSQCNRFQDVLLLFGAMQAEKVKADAVTMVKVVLACSHLGYQEHANSVINYIEENHVEIDVYLGNTLMDLYGRHGSVELAQKMFDRLPERNTVSWNTLIMGYVKVGDVVAARELFDRMPSRDVISWTSMITGYCQKNRFFDALMLFQQMIAAKVKPDEITVASVLSASAHLGMLDMGKAIHNYIRMYNIKTDVYVGNSLIDMYCKCGCIENALKVFREMTDKDTVSWTAIISGLAVNGYAHDAIDFFSQMLREDIQPSEATFVSVLLACAHTGLVEKGFEYFESMTKFYCMEPKMKHYGCMVDLLSRSGNLDRAFGFIKNMPVDPDPIVWRILLSACKLQGNVLMAEIVTKKLIESDPDNSGNYVLLSNTYAGADRWDDAMNMRELMKDSDVHKVAGCSFIEADGMLLDSVMPEKHPFPAKDHAFTG
ncbi:pentatricopeptide repeat-containing protein At2g22410, mitochondrial-like isoform X1 [Macadamia integrifolia]|uniref:pentatricopeptide repeat-containing protein At2g22410, mitochondrial-like isoform X1 n=1 Tax=Macadamia integrifolia TaxID=60698 RepID=UPI001C5275F6|nr:pentatricopeptide repeat-containing protein At2g22410, mitochondrial-like isoform X1 [Macadamia integrifolia]XP_042477985.1 pentatricopeptide repeat-containing protein At2g22410, mitochondrial-like isoform X1 [Macadamia integrifolia]